jgi:DNA-binding MarR family transcriptional regulator
MARVWAHSQCEGGELLVMLALADFSNDAGESWPSLEVLAQKARLTKRQVCKVLDKLQAAGEIWRERSTGGRNRRTRYFIALNPTENSEIKTVKKEHCNKNSVFQDKETVSSSSHALNRHRTVNKRESTESDKLIPNPLSTSVLSDPTPKKRKPARPDPATLEAFNRFYQGFPRRVAKQKGRDAWLKLSPGAELITVIMAAVERYAAEVRGTELKFIPHPATWLNGRRWEDEPAEGNNNGQGKPEVKDLGNGWLEVNGNRMDRKTYEVRYGRATA